MAEFTKSTSTSTLKSFTAVDTTLTGPAGPAGETGPRGAGRWHIQVSVLPTTSSEANTAYNTGSGYRPDVAVPDDQAWFYTGTLSNPTSQSVWIYQGESVWAEQEEVIDGNLIVAGTITATQINAEVGNFGQLVADIGTFTTLDTDTLDADSIIAREIQVFLKEVLHLQFLVPL